MSLNPWSRWHWAMALRVLRDGGVIAYPTEGVWGLGCRPDDPGAVERIWRLKHRSSSKGLIILVNSPGQVIHWLRCPDIDISNPRSTVTHPVTWVVPASAEAPKWIRGGDSSIAIRVSTHPLAEFLTNKFGPLVSTSANPAGRPPARNALSVRRYFPAGVDLLIPGELGGAAGPSEIRDGLTGAVLRKGRSKQ